MLTSNKLFFALAFLGGSATAQATDGTSKLVQGKTGESVDAYGAYLGAVADHYYSSYPNVFGTHNGIQLSQAILLGSFDPGLRSNYIF